MTRLWGGSKPASSAIGLIRVSTGRDECGDECAFRPADNGLSLGSWMSGSSLIGGHHEQASDHWGEASP